MDGDLNHGRQGTLRRDLVVAVDVVDPVPHDVRARIGGCRDLGRVVAGVAHPEQRPAVGDDSAEEQRLCLRGVLEGHRQRLHHPFGRELGYRHVHGRRFGVLVVGIVLHHVVHRVRPRIGCRRDLGRVVRSVQTVLEDDVPGRVDTDQLLELPVVRQLIGRRNERGFRRTLGDGHDDRSQYLRVAVVIVAVDHVPYSVFPDSFPGRDVFPEHLRVEAVEHRASRCLSLDYEFVHLSVVFQSCHGSGLYVHGGGGFDDGDQDPADVDVIVVGDYLVPDAVLPRIRGFRQFGTEVSIIARSVLRSASDRRPGGDQRLLIPVVDEAVHRCRKRLPVDVAPGLVLGVDLLDAHVRRREAGDLRSLLEIAGRVPSDPHEAVLLRQRSEIDLGRFLGEGRFEFVGISARPYARQFVLTVIVLDIVFHPFPMRSEPLRSRGTLFDRQFHRDRIRGIVIGPADECESFDSGIVQGERGCLDVVCYSAWTVPAGVI